MPTHPHQERHVAEPLPQRLGNARRRLDQPGRRPEPPGHPAAGRSGTRAPPGACAQDRRIADADRKLLGLPWRPGVRRAVPLDRARRAGARAPGRAPHPPRAGRAHLPPRRQHPGQRPRAALADRDRQRAPGPAGPAVLRSADRRRDVGQRGGCAATTRAAQAQRRRRLHLRRGGRAHVRGRADRDAGQLQPASGGDPPRLPVSLGQPQPHAAPLPGRHGRQDRGHARVRARPAAGPPDRADPA